MCLYILYTFVFFPYFLYSLYIALMLIKYNLVLNDNLRPIECISCYSVRLCMIML